jgi:hypothetical protein
MRAFSSGGDYCVPVVTPTPTPALTSLEMWEGGKDEALLGAIFWVAFWETSEDTFESGGLFDSPLSAFLVTDPFCREGANPPSNNANEAILQGDPINYPTAYWVYIQHCLDHRFMFARTMMNGFLSYERRRGDQWNYIAVNHGKFATRTSDPLWGFGICQDQGEAGTSYRNSQEIGTAPEWLYSYLKCITTSNDPSVLGDKTAQRIRRAYKLTLWPQILAAEANFYGLFVADVTTGAPTFGAYSNMDANRMDAFGNGDTFMSCVGQCIVGGNLVDTYFASESGADGAAFVIPATQIDEADIFAAYESHLGQQIVGGPSPYVPNRSSVLQPVLSISIDRRTNTILGYRWITRVFQRSDNLLHFPRIQAN